MTYCKSCDGYGWYIGRGNALTVCSCNAAHLFCLALKNPIYRSEQTLGASAEEKEREK